MKRLRFQGSSNAGITYQVVRRHGNCCYGLPPPRATEIVAVGENKAKNVIKWRGPKVMGPRLHGSTEPTPLLSRRVRP